MTKVKTLDITKMMQKGFLATACVLATLIIFSNMAHAQDPSQVDHYDQPYGLGYGDENRPFDANTRDADGNRVIVNGQFSSAGSHTTTSGVGGYNLTGRWGVNVSSSAIGNSLTVVTTGNNNTVIIDSTQINNGDQEAGIVLNGDIDFD